MTRNRWIALASTGLGLVVVLAYLNIATNALSLPERLTLLLAFAIGPVAIFGTLEVHRKLDPIVPGTPLRLGTVFLVVAFALFNLMLVVQQSVFTRFREDLRAAADEPAREALRLAFRSGNQVQLGIDVSFDIFYALGVFFVSIALAGASRFGRVLGVAGAVVAAGLLVLNLATFPVPPAEAGLVDLGPVTGVWWLVLILGGVTGRRLRRSAPG